jgi:hypothetical protein
MADFAALSTGSGGAHGPPSASMSRSGGDPRRRGGGPPPAAAEPSRHEIQEILGQFDAKINQMKDYPAKDVINSLTMLAERVQYAPEIVSFLETKIHRVNDHRQAQLCRVLPLSSRFLGECAFCARGCGCFCFLPCVSPASR